MAESYVTLFDVAVKDDADKPLFEAVKTCVVAWIRERQDPPRFEPSGGTVEDERGNRVYVDSDACPSAQYWRLRWDQPDNEGRPIHRVTEIRLAALDGLSVEVGLEIRVTSRAASAARASVDPPRIVGTLLNRFTCGIGGRRLSSEPQLVRVQDVTAFVEHNLISTERRLPIIALSPLTETNAQVLNANRLARSVASLAEVCVLETSATTFALTNVVGQEFSCFNGAVRMYMPGLDPASSDPYDHELWLRGQVDQPLFLERLYNDLARISERRVATGGPVWRDARSMCIGHHEHELRDAAERAELNELFVVDQEQRLRVFETERERLEQENRDLREERDDLKDEADALRENIRALSEQLRGVPADYRPVIRREIGSVADAVLAADEEFDHLHFLDEAYESAEDSNYERHEKVFEAFEALEQLAQERRADGSLRGDPRDLLGQRGIEYAAHETERTLSQHGVERTFRYRDRDVMVPSHIKFGNSRRPQHTLRMHCFWDADTAVWVIAWVGRHLDTVRT